MSGETVAGCLQGKEFVLVADALPSTVMEHADLVVPTGVFTEKEGTFFAGTARLQEALEGGGLRAGRRIAGFAFLSALLGQARRRRPIGAPHDVTARMREKGLIRGVRRPGRAAAGRPAASATARPQSRGRPACPTAAATS